MSRAFVKEDDQAGVAPLPDRPISPQRNLVTRRGLRLIEGQIAHYQGDLARASTVADREAIGRASRELRYWTARLATAIARTDDASICASRSASAVLVAAHQTPGLRGLSPCPAMGVAAAPTGGSIFTLWLPLAGSRTLVDPAAAASEEPRADSQQPAS